jgi:hypothetical protein
VNLGGPQLLPPLGWGEAEANEQLQAEICSLKGHAGSQEMAGGGEQVPGLGALKTSLRK